VPPPSPCFSCCLLLSQAGLLFLPPVPLSLSRPCIPGEAPTTDWPWFVDIHGTNVPKLTLAAQSISTPSPNLFQLLSLFPLCFRVTACANPAPNPQSLPPDGASPSYLHQVLSQTQVCTNANASITDRLVVSAPRPSGSYPDEPPCPHHLEDTCPH
jgi:hypothetical protein